MQRVRITVRQDPKDPAEDLRRAARVRRDLWAYSTVEIDPDSPRHRTQRDPDRNAYFEFATDRSPEVQRVLRQYGHTEWAKADVVENADGVECVSCGRILPQLLTVCPHCRFRDIDPCPYCNTEVPRLEYTPISGDLFKCMTCHRRVRFHFQDPPFNASGHYHQPLVCVSPAEAPIGHDV